MRQNPPVTVTGRGFSIVTVGGDDALTTVAIVITTAPTALTLFFFVMVNRIVRGLTDGFNLSHSCPSRPPRPSSPPIAFPKNQVKRETAALHPTWKGRFTAGTNPSTLLWEEDGRRKMIAAMTRLKLYCCLLGLLILLCGCASQTTRKTALIKSSKKVESSAAELSAHNQSLLGLYSAEIEAAADKIMLESPSASTRRQALVWKAEAIPILQRSLLNTDPLAAAIDAWAFIFQMTDYMNQPTVKQEWGEFHPVITEALKRMETEMEQLVQAAAPSGNLAATRDRVQAWAKAHPIEVGLSGRKSADAVLITMAEQTDLGTRASIKALGESIGDLTARLDSYNAYLPKQARWQAELLLSDLARDPQVAAAMSNLAVVSSALDKTSGKVDELPDMMAQMRKAVLADVEGQRLAGQAFLRQERLEALDSLDQMRIETMAGIDRERVAATADVSRERKIVLDTLENERETVMNDLHAAGEKAIQNFDVTSRGLIDHFFVRLLELFLVALVLGSLVTWLLLRRFTRRRWDHGERLYDRAA
jgi:hypothetical protein